MVEALTSRSEHIQWCKDRALALCEAGDLSQAFSSMVSDLQLHPETIEHIGIKIGTIQLFAGNLNTKELMINFIDGFN